MKTVGEALKGRRERLGMTLTELEQRTGIKREMLVHIENNEFDQLPNKNYSEGFIRKYASVVNIEPNQLIQAHQDEIPSNQAEWDEVITVFNNNKDLDYKSKSKRANTIISNHGYYSFNNFIVMDHVSFNILTEIN